MEKFSFDQSEYRGRNIQLKQQPGKDILIFGRGKLVQSLMAHGLIDEYHLQIHPVVLGHGNQLLKAGNKVKLKLIDSKIMSNGDLSAA